MKRILTSFFGTVMVILVLGGFQCILTLIPTHIIEYLIWFGVFCIIWLFVWAITYLVED